MLPSKKFLSLPIISLKEGQKIGYVRNLVVEPRTKRVAALVIEPKGLFKDQRIIPFNRVVSIGENAITLSTESQVEKATNLPDILDLLKEKTAIIGIKVVTENGKSLGVADEFYLDPENGKIIEIDISEGKIEGLFSGKVRLNAQEILTIGSDVIVVSKDSEEKLEVFNKGVNENIKSFFHAASTKASQTSQQINKYWKKTKKDKEQENEEQECSDSFSRLTPDEDDAEERQVSQDCANSEHYLEEEDAVDVSVSNITAEPEEDNVKKDSNDRVS